MQFVCQKNIRNGGRKIKPVNNYILLVDYYRRPSLQRNTRGRYRVGAKTPEEAVKLLRNKIKFGSILVSYKCDADNDKKAGAFVPYKTVVKEEPCTDNAVDANGNTVQTTGFKQIEPRSATDPIKNIK